MGPGDSGSGIPPAVRKSRPVKLIALLTDTERRSACQTACFVLAVTVLA